MPRLLSIGKLSEPLTKSPRHSHDVWELCLYTAGEGVASIGEERVPFKPGTIICYPPVIPHHEDSPGGCLEYYMLTEGFTAAAGSIPVFTDSPDAAFERLVAQLQHEFHLKEHGWEQITQQLFQLLLAYIDRWRGADYHPLLTRLKHIIMQSASDPNFSLPEAMDALPISTDHLRRLFVRFTGTTPSAYLMAMRIEEAKRLLQVLHLSVKETSRQAGFRDPAYFSRVFRKQTGVWPSDFADAALGVKEQAMEATVRMNPVHPAGTCLCV